MATQEYIPERVALCLHTSGTGNEVCCYRSRFETMHRIALRVRTCFSLGISFIVRLTCKYHRARLIGLYANEDFFKSLYEGTTSTMPIMPSPNGRGDTWAVNTMRSAANQDGMTLEETHVEHDANAHRRGKTLRVLRNLFPNHENAATVSALVRKWLHVHD